MKKAKREAALEAIGLSLGESPFLRSRTLPKCWGGPGGGRPKELIPNGSVRSAENGIVPVTAGEAEKPSFRGGGARPDIKLFCLLTLTLLLWNYYLLWEENTAFIV